MMRCREKSFGVGQARRMDSHCMTQTGKYRRLVQHDPVLYPVPEKHRRSSGVLAEPTGDIPIGESAAVLKRLWEIPVEQRDERRNSRA